MARMLAPMTLRLALALLTLALSASTAEAKPRLGLKWDVKSSVSHIAVNGTVKGVAVSKLRARLEQRVGKAWRARATSSVRRSRTFSLRWTPPRGSGSDLRVRVRVIRGHRTLLASPARRFRQGAATPRPPTVSDGPPAPATPLPAIPKPTDTSPLEIDGTSAIAVPDRDTIVGVDGYRVRVPAGTVTAPAEVTITPIAVASGDLTGPAVDVHIDADWQDGVKTVQVTLPLEAYAMPEQAGWAPAVVHDRGDGQQEIFSGAAVAVDRDAGSVTVSTATLSRFRSTLLPPRMTIISAPTAVDSREWARGLIRQYAGLDAQQPKCDPAADPARAPITGDAVAARADRGGKPPIKSCAELQAPGALWRLANNTGATLVYTASNDAVIDGVGASTDPLTTYAFGRRNAGANSQAQVDVPPGTEVRVSLERPGSGFVKFSSSASAIQMSTFVLQQIGGLIPESAVKSFYGALTDCGWSLTLSMPDLAATLRCVLTASSIAGSRVAKAVEAPLLLVNSIIRTSDLFSFAHEDLRADIKLLPEPDGTEGPVIDPGENGTVRTLGPSGPVDWSDDGRWLAWLHSSGGPASGTVAVNASVWDSVTGSTDSAEVPHDPLRSASGLLYWAAQAPSLTITDEVGTHALSWDPSKRFSAAPKFPGLEVVRNSPDGQFWLYHGRSEQLPPPAGWAVAYYTASSAGTLTLVADADPDACRGYFDAMWAPTGHTLIVGPHADCGAYRAINVANGFRLALDVPAACDRCQPLWEMSPFIAHANPVAGNFIGLLGRDAATGEELTVIDSLETGKTVYTGRDYSFSGLTWAPAGQRAHVIKVSMEQGEGTAVFYSAEDIDLVKGTSTAIGTSPMVGFNIAPDASAVIWRDATRVLAWRADTGVVTEIAEDLDSIIDTAGGRWSPDASLFAYIKPAGPDEYATLVWDPRSNTARVALPPAASGTELHWSADGKYLLRANSARTPTCEGCFDWLEVWKRADGSVDRPAVATGRLAVRLGYVPLQSTDSPWSSFSDRFAVTTEDGVSVVTY